MTAPVRYHRPGCGALTSLDRPATIADKSVTSSPAVGWCYGEPDDDTESAKGGRLVWGEHTDAAGFGRPFYSTSIRFNAGIEIDPTPEPASDGPHFEPRTPDAWGPAYHA